MTSPERAAQWVVASDEPWTRYRAMLDIKLMSRTDPLVTSTRAAMLSHPAVVDLVARANEWPGYPLQRHNDAAHPIYTIATLADFGLGIEDPGIGPLTERVLDHFDGEAFESLLRLPRFLTKETDTDDWAWMLCDAPTLLYSLLAFGLGSHPSVAAAVAALKERVEDNAWRCGATGSLPKFSGPGRKADTCPIATTYALKALSLTPDLGADAARRGTEALLAHWEDQKEYKLRMFGIGTDFRKLKYPYVWYDLLHVTDVLSRFPETHRDRRLGEMVAEIVAQADPENRYRPGSMYRAWQGWSFANKKQPSPWLTMLVLRIQARLAGQAQ